MQEIQALIASEMLALQEQIQALAKSNDLLLQQVIQHTFQAPGKQIRPMLVFLGAGACGGITAKALPGALLVTLLHQASIVHDDVVDEATHRRARPTIHTAWNNKVAVLFGDYLFATIFHLAIQQKDHELLELITETARAMSKGELLQLAQVHAFDTTKAVYLDIIHKKTAHLFGTCLAVGATAARAPTTQVSTLRQVGEQIGMGFQLKDDWLDYTTGVSDKPLGKDLKEGKLTLPLIHALEKAPAKRRKVIFSAIKHAQHHPQQQAEVLAFVRQSPGMDYTQKMMVQYQKKALHTLSKTTPSSYQEALRTLIQHII